MIFFAHPNFPAPLANLIQAYDEALGNGHAFEIQPYPPDTPDPEWYPVAAKRRPKPYILIFDNEGLRRKQSRIALHKLGLTFVHFKGVWRTTPLDEAAWRVIKYWRKIELMCSAAKPASIIEVSIHGKLFAEKL